MSVPPSMRALVLDGPTTFEALRAVEIPGPACADGDLLVEVRAAAINPSDVLNMLHGLPITTYPRVPGRDFAGIVVAGPPERIRVEVWGTGSGDLGFSRHGTHAEYVAVPGLAAIPLPTGWSHRDAGASGLSYATAAAMIEWVSLNHGDLALITGAVGVVGSAACAIARWRDARVIGAVKNAGERARLMTLFPGVDSVVTDAGTLAEDVAALTEARGVDVVIDTVGNPVFAQAIEAVAPGARIAVIAGVPGASVDFDLSAFYRRDLTLHPVNTTRHSAAWCARLLLGLVDGFASGALPAVEVEAPIELSDAGTGYRTVSAGNASGRVIFALGV
jgi:NADPH:quinone reductase